jgi:hypothetical protein
MAKKKKDISNIALMSTIRGNWNGINPVTRIVESKKYKPTKHKKKSMEDAKNDT